MCTVAHGGSGGSGGGSGSGGIAKYKKRIIGTVCHCKICKKELCKVGEHSMRTVVVCDWYR